MSKNQSVREFKDVQSYADGLAKLKDLKVRLTKASQQKVSGMGLSPIYSEIKKEISELDAMCSRFRAKNPKVSL